KSWLPRTRPVCSKYPTPFLYRTTLFTGSATELVVSGSLAWSAATAAVFAPGAWTCGDGLFCLSGVLCAIVSTENNRQAVYAHVQTSLIGAVGCYFLGTSCPVFDAI